MLGFCFKNLIACSTATAKLIFSPGPFNVLIPIKFPETENNGPPEFPGLMGV